MKFSRLVYMLVAWWAASICYAQIANVKIDYNLSLLTNSAGPRLGSLMPLTDSISLINLGYVRLGLVNNYHGQIKKVLDERELVDKIIKVISVHPDWKNYRLLGLDEQNIIPSLFKARILYSNAYKIGDNQLAVGVTLPVSKVIPDFANNVLAGVVYMDYQLQVKKFIIREWYQSDYVVDHSCGGYFMNDSAFYISCEVPMGSTQSPEQPKFLYYSLQEGIFKLDKDKAVGRLPKLNNYYVGRFYRIFKEDDHYRVFNGESLAESVDLQCIDADHQLPIKGNEIFMSLMPIGEKNYVGIISDLGLQNTPQVADLIILNHELEVKRILTRYDLRQFTLNSVEYHNGKLYIYIVDQRKTLPLLQIISLNEKNSYHR